MGNSHSIAKMSGDSLNRFISREALLKAVQKFARRTDIILSDDFDVKMATSKVEGMLSTVLRVKVFFRFDEEDGTQSKIFFYKTLPTQEFSLNVIKCRGIFEMETMFFQTIAPLMERASAGRLQLPFPQCYYAQSEGKGVIVMEDLAEDGYRTVDRDYLHKGLDLSHCLLAMKNIGILHALGIAAERDPVSGCDFRLKFGHKQILFYDEEPGEMVSPVKILTEIGMKTLVELSGEVQGLPSKAKASGALVIVVKRCWKTVCELVKPTSEGPNVLSHGDYWMLNLMYKYEDDGFGNNIPVDAKIIDYQLTRYCHPSVDILQFLYLSLKTSLINEYMERLLTHYHQSLTNTLETLRINSPPITLKQLIVDVREKYKLFGVILAMVFKPGLLLGDDFAPQSTDTLSAEDLEEIFTDGNSSKVKERFANDPVFQSGMTELITDFVEMALPGGPDDPQASPLLK